MLKQTNLASVSYGLGYRREVVEHLFGRNVQTEARFFLPCLKPGMTLLDCGCGPGSITIGLAEAVSPGRVIGIDREPSQLTLARERSIAAGATNIDYRTADVYALPFPANSFDALFAHALLQHLADPVRALREMWRVLKPSGVIGVRDDDRGALLIAPSSPKVLRLIELHERVLRQHGGDSRLGRRHRELLRSAGFARSVASASCEYHGIMEATKRRSELAARAAETYIAETAIPLGWITKDELKELAKACLEWGNNSESFDAIIWCEAIAWKE